MSQTITISDDLFARLEQSARQRGLANLEQLIDAWATAEDDLRRRRAAVQRVHEIRDKLYSAYGELPDSTDWIRKDRAR